MRLLAANRPYTSDMGGVSGADHACYRQARDAGLTGSTFRAFIAGRVQDLHSVIHRRHHDRRHIAVVNAKVCYAAQQFRNMYLKTCTGQLSLSSKFGVDRGVVSCNWMSAILYLILVATSGECYEVKAGMV